METRIEHLITKINRIVLDEVTEYIDEQIDALLREMAIKYNLSYDELSEDYKRSRRIGKRKCTMTTTLGNACKYDAKPNEAMCKKHFNKVHNVHNLK